MKSVHIIGVPLDLGGNRRGTDMGPSAFRIAGLGDQIAKLGFQVTDKGDVIAEHVVNAAGLWAREVGRMVGIELPVLAMSHHYLITDDMPEVAEHVKRTGKEMPMALDFSGEIYIRQEGGAIVIVMTRWAERDLTGRVLKDAGKRDALDEWEVIELPAILPSGNPLWPEFWSLEELTALKEELPNAKWQAQYQQNPVGNESAIVKRDWWKWWEEGEPPQCEFILQSWDTAFEKTQRADYSAGTTWGVFMNPKDGKSAGQPALAGC